MSAMDEHELREALDLLAIGRLQAAYGDAVTRRAWSELVPMFLPDCPIHLDLRDGTVIDHVGPDAIGAFIGASIERFELFEFALLNAVASVQGDEATGRVYMWELRQDAASHQWTNAFGLYRDRYQRLDGSWVFAARHYSSLARTADDGKGMDVFTVPGIAG
ncbi:MAG: hypothetical protein QOH64_809 [Acidimicrobiaceae bacterium]|jgi:hypothetical protein